METLDALADRLQGLRTTSGSLFDVVMQLNESNQLTSGLDVRTWVLVRLAALAASDAPVESYLALLSVAEDEGVSPEDYAGTLVAVAPAIGGPRIMTAASRLAEATASG